MAEPHLALPGPGIPLVRLRTRNAATVRPDGDFVLYWMTSCRRTGWNYGLQRATDWAASLRRPLLILEALRIGYPWASDRLHQFVLDGMAENARALEPLRQRGISYYPYVEPEAEQGKGLLAALARRACLVVTDEFPAFFLPRMIDAAARSLTVLLEQVDSNGLLPLRAADREFTTAHSFRRFLQKNLVPHLEALPLAEPLAGLELPPLPALPQQVRRRWPSADLARLCGEPSYLRRLPIDHAVVPVTERGGQREARLRLRQFLDEKLGRYADTANHPDDDSRTGLSPYLHFGHLSPHEWFADLTRREGWSPAHLAARATGKREGWWGLSPSAEALLDQLVTWRELGFNLCARREDCDQYDSLPDWAQKTLDKHAADRRSHLYTLEEFESGRTHDALWNAAQTQLMREGRIHNYLRMLWGKKILEWSPGPREALAVMIELNNKYALDGRDPNSYNGIFWVLGRYDRPWGPERPVFGTVRYMSSQNTLRKVRARGYLTRYGNATV